MFEATTGDPPHQNTVGYWWRKTCRAAGVAGGTLHDLRHYLASGLIAAGCEVVTVRRALGHAKATTTLNTYAHLWPSAADRTRGAAAGSWQQRSATVRTLCGLQGEWQSVDLPKRRRSDIEAERKGDLGPPLVAGSRAPETPAQPP